MRFGCILLRVTSVYLTNSSDLLALLGFIVFERVAARALQVSREQESCCRCLSAHLVNARLNTSQCIIKDEDVPSARCDPCQSQKEDTKGRCKQ